MKIWFIIGKRVFTCKLDMFAESKCYFLADVVLLMKFPPTSAKVPGSTPGHG